MVSRAIEKNTFKVYVKLFMKVETLLEI